MFLLFSLNIDNSFVDGLANVCIAGSFDSPSLLTLVNHNKQNQIIYYTTDSIKLFI
ncbi:protein of unknown function [Moritella yayanosii]|uniref:Uncharacterized protein n=1 Tax=Moritella yayanosii TaxID=69539 RepID=A0A330LR66_9GAMM|nr:protein of unknown function [Moritella yayanosii]